MRSQFRPGQLPNETPFKSARSDISSFRTLYHGVQEIDAACSAKESQPGWYEIGMFTILTLRYWHLEVLLFFLF